MLDNSTEETGSRGYKMLNISEHSGKENGANKHTGAPLRSANSQLVQSHRTFCNIESL